MNQTTLWTEEEMTEQSYNNNPRVSIPLSFLKQSEETIRGYEFVCMLRELTSFKEIAALPEYITHYPTPFHNEFYNEYAFVHKVKLNDKGDSIYVRSEFLKHSDENAYEYQEASLHMTLHQAKVS
jgi:hypothetical protein